MHGRGASTRTSRVGGRPPRTRARPSLILLLAVLACLIPAAAAQAQTLPIQTFQYTYRGFSPYVDWEWWLSSAQRCQETQPVYGAEPTTGGPYPVVIYLHSTLADWANNNEGQLFAAAAAAQGYEAVAFTYDSWLTWSSAAQIDSHAECMFGADAPGNAVSQVCARAKADCSHGILVVGFSQGGAMATQAANYYPHTAAVWAMGVNAPVVPQELPAPGGTRALPNSALRITDGWSDLTSSGSYNASAVEQITGDTCGTNPDCLQPDGSGYYVVTNAQDPGGNSSHCFMDLDGDCSTDPVFNSGFAPPSTQPWSLISGLDWLKTHLTSTTTARR